MVNSALRAGADTDTGKQREHNEDAYLCHPDEGFFAAIDGVGGYAGGEVAAAEARDAIRRRLLHRTDAPEVRLREAVTNANNKIYWRSQEEPRLFGMACVLTVALLEDNQLYIAHVGDTRLYKIRGHRIEKLTRDHSFVGMQEDRQALSEYEAMHHPRRNEILRDVGSEHHEPDDANFIDIIEASFEPDCALLLCSDGLTDLVPSRDLLRLSLEHAGTPQAAAKALIAAANDAGGTDNITVVMVEGPDFGQPYLPEPTNHAETPRPAPLTPDTPTAPLPPNFTRDTTPQAAPLAAPSSSWRSFLYGFAMALALIAIAFAAWTLTRGDPPPVVPTPGTTASTDSLPGAINALLAAAQPGDTVVVPPGIYRETLHLRSGITVRSAEPDSVRLLPPTDSTWTDSVAVRAENITGAALLGISIGPDTTGGAERAFSVGIHIRRAAVHIDAVTITGTREAGVAIDSDTVLAAPVVLQKSMITNNGGTGVVVREAQSLVRILDNEILSNAGAGVALLHEARPELQGNTILGNGEANIEIRLDTTIARLRARNTLTGEAPNTEEHAVRIGTPQNQDP